MKQLRPALMTFILLSAITGLIYPLLVTVISQTFFPYAAQGSLLQAQGQLIGSELIGQNFTQDKYLWGRPSATADHPYNPLASSGTNLGPSNLQLRQMVQQRRLQLNSSMPAPIDLVTSSASGLDPEISLAAAYFQQARIARARRLTPLQVATIINRYAEYPFLGIWGEARVNVLLVNLALDNTSVTLDRSSGFQPF